MKRALLIVLAIATGGCSIVLKPDRDAIVRSMDAGFDADPPDDGGPDGGPDAGPDAGDAGCIPEQDFEVSCNDEMDNDCDGLVDCDELECGASGFCCETGSGGPWVGNSTDFSLWDDHPAGGVMVATPTRVEFGTAQASLSHPVCAPLAFGMRFEIWFQIESGGSADDFASFLLAPVNEPGGGSFLADFRLRVNGDDTALAERAGTVIGRTTMPLGTVRLRAIIDLQPGIDDAGRPVLFVTAFLNGQELAKDFPLMPLADLRGTSVMCDPEGLFAVVEGDGTRVEIVSALTATTLECDSPTEFRDDSGSRLGTLDEGFEPGMWRAGGLGEPTLFHVGSPMLSNERIDVLADTSVDERSDELVRFIDFSIGGGINSGSTWTPRRTPAPGSQPELLGATPSSREPSIFVPNLNGVASGTSLLLAFAREVDLRSSRFEIALTSLELAATSGPGSTYAILEPTDGMVGGTDLADCESLRDPSIIALGPMPTTAGLLVFFTCEPTTTAPSWIGAAHLTFDGMRYQVGTVFPELLTSDVGEYGNLGVLSPEVIITGTSPMLELRLWYLARSSSGRVRLAFAFGEVDADGTPHLSPFGGNPILDPEDPVLGGACPLGCAIDSIGVMRTTDARGFWPEQSYVFLIDRSEFTAIGVDHELIPLRQPTPSGG